jgi:hypothetical protein
LKFSNIVKGDVYSTLFFPDLFEMDGEQHVPSNESNPPSPAHLCSPAPPPDGRSHDAQLSNFPVSSSSQGALSFMSWSTHYLKVAADQGTADAQNNYGLCLKNGKGVRIDLAGAAHYFKLAADQGFAVAQYNYGNCLYKGEGVGIDFEGSGEILQDVSGSGR